MVAETIERDFRTKVCEKVSLVTEGVQRYRVFTPFMFDDGDHLSIVLKRESSGWVLSDEGHTYMHLTYELAEKDLRHGTRSRIITNALAAYCVDDRDGELVLRVPGDRYGDALYSFVQALLKVADVSFLSRERVRSTFLDDFRRFLEEVVPAERAVFKWHDEQRDPQAMYEVDCRINGMPRPVFCFALLNDGKVKDATINLMQFERWGLNFRSVGIYQNQEEINPRVVARFTDVCEKQFSTLAENNRDRITKYLREAWSTNSTA
ncbi:MAG: DUF1828 domain-containing protein [Planctomycetes bacterium]|nr:DUF1828 domain-containing protein [Planctomycetota bacterium]MBU4400341.1 DUF1828 domain-containing protein [Planctomycetota bacterium]MCG2685470.1 DUF1828 domain-containing protein [Planctomycetales bacterium]